MSKISKFGSNILFVVLVASLGMSTYSWADEFYTVQKGDSLYKISRKFKTNVEALKKANELDSAKLALGAKLIIPSKDIPKEDLFIAKETFSTVGIAAKNVKADISPNKNMPQLSGKAELKMYEVEKGDSLWEIAKKLSISVTEIKRLNHLKSTRLKLGQKLIVGQEPAIIETEAAAPLATQNKSDYADSGESDPLSQSQEKGNGKLKDLLMFIAQKTLGIPYRFGSSSSKSTDCSGYVQRVFNSLGIQLPRSAREQFNHGVTVDKENLSLGDLVFFRTYASFPSHVGIYLGNNLFIHASTLARKVTIDKFNTPYYMKRFIGAKRLQGLDELNVANPQEPSAVAVR